MKPQPNSRTLTTSANVWFPRFYYKSVLLPSIFFYINFCCNHFQSSVTVIQMMRWTNANIDSVTSVPIWLELFGLWSTISRRFPTYELVLLKDSSSLKEKVFCLYVLFPSLLLIPGSGCGLVTCTEKTKLSKKLETRQSQNFQRFTPRGVG